MAASLTFEALVKHTQVNGPDPSRTVELYLAALTADPPLEDVIESTTASDDQSELVSLQKLSKVGSMRSRDGSSGGQVVKRQREAKRACESRARC